MNRVIVVSLFALLIQFAPGATASAQSRSPDDVAARSSRPRVVIQPHRYRLGPNAKRECRAKLVQEYRVSGPVIVPQTICWWE